MFGVYNELVTRVVAGGALTYASYIVWTCPCMPYITSCHSNSFWASLGIAAGFILLQYVGDSGQEQIAALIAEHKQKQPLKVE